MSDRLNMYNLDPDQATTRLLPKTRQAKKAESYIEIS